MRGSYFSLPFLRKGSGCRGNPCQVQDRVLRNGVKNSGRGAKSVQWTFFAWGNPSEGFPQTPPGRGAPDRGGSREFPLCEAEAPTEAVDLRGRGGSLCPPVKWNHPQSKSNSFGMNYRREGMEPLPYTAVVRLL